MSGLIEPLVCQASSRAPSARCSLADPRNLYIDLSKRGARATSCEIRVTECAYDDPNIRTRAGSPAVLNIEGSKGAIFRHLCEPYSNTVYRQAVPSVLEHVGAGYCVAMVSATAMPMFRRQVMRRAEATLASLETIWPPIHATVHGKIRGRSPSKLVQPCSRFGRVPKPYNSKELPDKSLARA
jgi:hypothetical protein